MIFRLLPALLFLWLIAFPPTQWAVETAPRISDREIIDKLARLEEGQRSLSREMQQQFLAIEQRFSAMEKSIDERFSAMEKSIDARFAAMQKVNDERFVAMQKSIDERLISLEQRFDFLESLMLVLIASILGLVGFVVWDRKTALRPLEQKLNKLEQDLKHDLELQNPEGSRLTRLIHALREQAKEDPKLAEILRGFSLL